MYFVASSGWKFRWLTLGLDGAWYFWLFWSLIRALMLYSYSPPDDTFHFGGKCIKLRKKTTQQLQQVPETDQTDQAPLPYSCINRRNSSESMFSDKPGCTAGKDTLPTLSAACKLCSELQASNFCKKSSMLRWTFGELSLNHSCSCKWPQ